MPKYSMKKALEIWDEEIAFQENERQEEIRRKIALQENDRQEEIRRKIQNEELEKMLFTLCWEDYITLPEFEEKVIEKETETETKADSKQRKSGRRFRRLMARKNKVNLYKTAITAERNYSKRFEDCMNYKSTVNGVQIIMRNHPITRVKKLFKKVEKLSS